MTQCSIELEPIDIFHLANYDFSTLSHRRGKMTRIWKRIYVVVIVALVLSLGAVSVPQGWASPGDEDLEISGGELLWCQSISGEDPDTSVYVVGDLNCDGLPDVLVATEVGPEEDRTATLIAKKGSDGSHLWEQSVTGEDASIWGYGVDDLDCDNKTDVLVHIRVGPYENRTATLIAKKGSDGSHLWAQNISGYAAYMSAEPADDLDCDDKTDVLVESEVGPSDNRTATVIAKRGHDGYHLWAQNISGYYAYMNAEPVDDLNCDGKTDVLVETRVGPYGDRTATVIAKRGYDGTHLWAENISGYDAYMWAEPADDLNCDNKTDVLVGIEVGPYDNRTATVIAKRGYDGTHLWAENISGRYAHMWADPVDDLDCDNKTDVLVGTELGPSEAENATLIAKIGHNGTHLWAQNISGYDAYMEVYPVDDLDCDGKTDVLVETEVGPSDNRTATLIAKRGHDGYHLWEESIRGEDAYISGRGVDDLDCDDKTDVLVRTELGPEEDRTATLTARKGVDGRLFWRETTTGEDASMVGHGVGDLDCDGKTDVLVETRIGPEDEITSSTFIAKKGVDGTHILEAESDQEIDVADMEIGRDEYSYDYDLDGDGQLDLIIFTDNQVCAVALPSCEVLPPVGGEAYPGSKMSLLAPWIAVGIVLAGGLIWYVLRRRRAES
jgi:hypothetical protein